MKDIIVSDKESQGLSFEVVTDPKRARSVIKTIQASGKEHSIDFETTGLRPKDGAEVRLTNIYGPAFRGVLDHWFCGSFKSMADDLADCGPWFVYEAKFEGRFFDFNTEEPTVELYDIGLMDKAVLGGYGYSSLAYMCKRDLGVILSKELQASNWAAKELSNEQYQYAFDDAYYTYNLAVHWLNEMDNGQWNGFLILNDAWRGTVEMEDCGMELDVAYHSKLIAMWARRKATAERTLRKWTPPNIIPNLNSKKQLGKFIGQMLDDVSRAAWPKTPKKKELKTERKILQQASFRSPYPFSRWLAALMVYNRASKYLSTYGEKLITAQKISGGRVHTKFNMAQAVTGRYSSSGGVNLQNIPNSPVVRRSFVAPKGATYVIADYSGIELRVLAEDADDEVLRHDVIFSNMHARAAAQLYGMDYDWVIEQLAAKNQLIKERRTRSKFFSFQLTYGAGFSALAVVMRSTDDEAQEFIRKWAARYKLAYEYRYKRFEEMNKNAGFMRLRSGRTIKVPKDDRTLPVASNYPIQGSAGDVMYRAIYHVEVALRRLWKKEGIAARMCATIHDELVLITLPKHGDRVKQVLVECMKQAWLDIFPNTSTDNLVEAAIGLSWADKE